MILAGVTEVVISFLHPVFEEVQNKIISAELNMQLFTETMDYMWPSPRDFREKVNARTRHACTLKQKK